MDPAWETVIFTFVVIVAIYVYFFFQFRVRFICSHCGYVGNPVTETGGSTVIEILLWLFFLIPGMFYSLLRSSSKRKVCPECRAPYMVPLDSARGQQLLEEFEEYDDYDDE